MLSKKPTGCSVWTVEASHVYSLGDRGTIGNFWKLAPIYFQRKILPTQQGSRVCCLICEGVSPTWNSVHIVSFMQLEVCLLCSWCVFCAAGVSFVQAVYHHFMCPSAPRDPALPSSWTGVSKCSPMIHFFLFFWKHKLSICYDFFNSHVIFWKCSIWRLGVSTCSCTSWRRRCSPRSFITKVDIPMRE